MSPRRVLVTRPEPGASATAQRLKALGFEPLVMPLSRTVALPTKDTELQVAEAVLITSANAIRHVGASLIENLKRLPWLAVGDATAAACAEMGVERVVSIGGDAADMGDVVLSRYAPGARLTYLCGKVRRPELESRLKAAGLIIQRVEIYNTVEMEFDSEALNGKPIDTGLIYSPNAGVALAQLVAAGRFEQSIPARWIAISRRAAEPLEALGIKVLAATQPTEAGMLLLLG